MRLIIAIFCMSVSFVLPTFAQDLQPYAEHCEGRGNGVPAYLIVAGCSGLLASGQVAPEFLAAIYNNRGLGYEDQGRTELAIGDYTEAIRLEPKLAVAYSNRGNAYIDIFDFESAIHDHDSAVELNPSSAGAFNNRCWARALLNREPHQALADCEAAIQLANDPNTLPLLFGSFGLAQLRVGIFQPAIESLTTSLTSGENALISTARGIAHYCLGNLAAAQADFDAARNRNPNADDEYARYDLILGDGYECQPED